MRSKSPQPELTAAALSRYGTPPARVHETPSTEVSTPGTSYFDTMGGETPVEGNFPFPSPHHQVDSPDLPPPPAFKGKRLSFPAEFPPNNLSHPPSFYSPYGSDSNLTIHGGSEYEPYGSPADTPEGTPTVLQIRHSDSFESQREAHDDGAAAGLGFGAMGEREVPTITVGAEGDEWDLSADESDEGEGESGGDQAGVILGYVSLLLCGITILTRCLQLPQHLPRPTTIPRHRCASSAPPLATR